MSATKTIGTTVLTLLLLAGGASAQDVASRALDSASNVLVGHRNGQDAGGARAFAALVNQAGAALARAPHTDPRAQRRAALIIEAALREGSRGPLLRLEEGLSLLTPRERFDLGETFMLVHAAIAGARDLRPLSFATSQDMGRWVADLRGALQTTRALVTAVGRKGHVLPAQALRLGLEVAVERHARRQVFVAGRVVTLGRLIAPIGNSELSSAPAPARPARPTPTMNPGAPLRGITNRLPGR